jgi:hypothetical protein
MAGKIGPAMFEHACRLGLEGIVSKHRDRAYRDQEQEPEGPSDDWVPLQFRFAQDLRTLVGPWSLNVGANDGL